MDPVIAICTYATAQSVGQATMQTVRSHTSDAMYLYEMSTANKQTVRYMNT